MKLSAILLISLLFILASCASTKIEGQGIQGQLIWLEGNQMPKITDEPLEEKGDPVKRTLVIYPLTNMGDGKMEDGLFISLASQPIMEVESDGEGKFSIELDPGRYSIFTKEEGGLFANSFDMDGNIQPVEVKTGEWATMKILIDYKAYY